MSVSDSPPSPRRRGRPTLPPEQRRPKQRRSGPSGRTRQPTLAEAKAQREAMEQLARKLGQELYRLGLTANQPASWGKVARAAGLSDPAVVRRVTLDPGKPGARYTEPETLQRWADAVQGWIAADPATREDILSAQQYKKRRKPTTR